MAPQADPLRAKLPFIDFDREKSTFLKGLLSQTHILMEKHFFIWSHLKCVCKGLYLNGANVGLP